MANETPEMNLLPEGAQMPGADVPVEAQAAPADMPMAEAVPTGDEGFDIDDLLSQIDSATGQSAAPQPQAAPEQDSAQKFAEALELARNRMNEREAFESQDVESKRLSHLEKQVNELLSRNAQLERESNRASIHSTINQGINKELTDLGIDVEGKAAKGIGRLITNSVLVAVAQSQAATGSHHVDPSSIGQTVKQYTKVVTAVAKELANRQQNEERLSSGGARPAPYKLSKPLGELSDEEFGNVILANLRGM